MIQTGARGHTRTPQPAAFPAIVRPAGAPRATVPVAVPEPSHHHLPAWVRRAHTQASPILADLLGSLDGDARDDLQRGVDAMTERISAGKFSQAFQYPQLITAGMELYQQQRRAQAEAARVERALESSKRRATEQLRDSTARLTADAASRLQKALRSASSPEEITQVETEIGQAMELARTVEDKRREREIHRTRTRIQKAAPRVPTAAADPTETWQDVLRRLQDQMAQEAGAS